MRRLAPAITLFFLAPLVAEFFLGDFPITLFFAILALAPMYGGGALLIREVTRRSGRGWPTIVLLGLAFGVVEEGLVTQSLFNPGYLDAHLLDVGYVHALGIAVPWTLFVLTLHTVWSISTPVALVEESTPARRTQPWLGRVGLAVVAALYLAGVVIVFAISYGQSKHYVASPAKLGSAVLVAAVLAVVALRLPRVDRAVRREGGVPRPWLVFVLTLVAGVLFMTGTALPTWLGVATVAVILALVVVFVARWSAREPWSRWHRLALACGALLTYSWHAFTMGGGTAGHSTFAIDLVSHIVYALGALAVVWFAVRHARRQAAAQPNGHRVDAAPTVPGQRGVAVPKSG